MLEKIQKEVSDLGFRFLSTEWTDREATYRYQCPQGHEFDLCHRAFRERRRNRCHVCTPDVKDRIHQEFRDWGLELLSEYEAEKKPLQIRCATGHVFTDTYKDLKRRVRKCPTCGGVKNNQRYTLEQVRKIVSDLGFKYLSDYYRSQTEPGEFECPKGHRYWVSLKTFLRGGGPKRFRCQQCSNADRRVPWEVVTARIEEMGYTLVDSHVEYKDKDTEIQLLCPQGHVWKSSWHKIWSGFRCATCFKPVAHTLEAVREFGRTKNVELLSQEYRDAHSPLRWKCLKRGHDFTRTFSQLSSRRYGCAECVQIDWLAWNKIPREEVIRRIESTGAKYLGNDPADYRNHRSKLRFQCSEGHEYLTTWFHFQGGAGCATCGILSMRTHTPEFIQNFLAEYGCRLVSSGVITRNQDLIEIECEFGHRTTRRWYYSYYMKRLCSTCRMNKPERELQQYMKSLGVEMEYANRQILDRGHELDFVSIEKKLAIEYCGLYWHSDVHQLPKEHWDKRVQCEQKGIRLITIFEDAWRDKNEIVKSILANAVNVNTRKLRARETVLVELEYSRARDFLVDNHLQGSVPALALGLEYNGELVSVFTYKMQGEDLEIVRFSNRKFETVTGALEKLLQRAISLHNPRRITSFVDLRYFTGSSLKKIGFTLESTSPGWQWTNHRNTFNRLACRANMDERGLTQKQYAQELGWNKIYDCGQALFIRKL